MNLTVEQLNAVEEMAGLFFSPADIAVFLQLDEDDTEYFLAAIECRNTRNPTVEAYFRGWLTAEVALRKAISQSAKNGSSPSQQQLINYMKEANV